MLRRPIAVLTLALLVAPLFTAPLAALPVPSKTAEEQSVADRDAELAALSAVLAEERVSAEIARHGFTVEQVHERLAQLSPDELQALNQQIDQVQAAGTRVPQYIWILLAIFLGVVIVGAL